MTTIVLGNKNYSSWSMRAWLALELTGAPYEEVVIPLEQPETAEQIRRHSPSGRVPVLLDEGVTIWDSLAICEHLAERHPSAGLWPRDPAARAIARAASAEMHSSFQALRAVMPMNIRLHRPKPAIPADVAADVARIRALWRECRARAGGGEFLFGPFTIADAMFAPVVARFRTYGVALEGREAAYADAVWSHAAVQRWVAAARAEPFVVPKYDAA
jgi:glutathione S-transferase